MNSYKETMKYCNDVYTAVQALLNYNVDIYCNLINDYYSYKADAFFWYGDGVQKENWCAPSMMNFYSGRNKRCSTVSFMHTDVDVDTIDLNDYMDSTEEDVYFQYSTTINPELLKMITLFKFLRNKNCKKFAISLDHIELVLRKIKAR